jgi:hypothetical protein
VSRVAISIQTLNGRDTSRKDVYLRKEVGTLNKAVILAAVEEMLDDREAHTIGSKTQKRSWRTKAYKPDEEQLPGVVVDATVEAAVALT